jgi:hypothetical protein
MLMKIFIFFDYLVYNHQFLWIFSHYDLVISTLGYYETTQ